MSRKCEYLKRRVKENVKEMWIPKEKVKENVKEIWVPKEKS